MTRTEVIAQIKEQNIKTERPAHQMKTDVLAELIAKHDHVTSEFSTRGRKTDPTSARQKRFEARKAILDQGLEIARGRKPNHESARQQRLAAWAARAASGEVIRRGRPKSIQQ
jgi:hypothetical protein